MIKLGKSIAIQILAFSIIVGGVGLAVTFPTDTPTGQTAGGKFMEYFNKIRVDCGIGKVLQGYDSNFDKICVSIGGTVSPKPTNTISTYKLNAISTYKLNAISDNIQSDFGITVNENDFIQISLSTTNVPDNTKVYFTLGGTAQVGKDYNKLFPSDSYFTIVNNTALIQTSTLIDNLKEGSEYFTLTLDSVIPTKSVKITINDSTSTPTYTYSWSTGTWSSCSASCGSGKQTRIVSCKGSDGITGIDEACSLPKSSTEQNCNNGACSTQTSGAYTYGSWSSCSVSCGGGIQTRQQFCNFDSCYSPQSTSQTCNNLACYVAPAPVSVNGACGTANDKSRVYAPITNLCSIGIAGAVTKGTNYTWSCAGANGGSTSNCSASILKAPISGSSTATQTSINFTWNNGGGIPTNYRVFQQPQNTFLLTTSTSYNRPNLICGKYYAQNVAACDDIGSCIDHTWGHTTSACLPYIIPNVICSSSNTKENTVIGWYKNNGRCPDKGGLDYRVSELNSKSSNVVKASFDNFYLSFCSPRTYTVCNQDIMNGFGLPTGYIYQPNTNYGIKQ